MAKAVEQMTYGVSSIESALLHQRRGHPERKRSVPLSCMENSRSLQFSQFLPNEFDGLCQLLSTVFQTSSEELARLYQQLDSTFDEDGWPPHHVDRKFFESQDGQFQEIYEQSPSVAVDLPSLLETHDGSQDKPTIVVLGQDSKSGQSHQDISLGTPYGLHHKGSREQLKSTKLYFEMIQVLMKLGYRVYLTDVFKVWVCNPQRPYCGIRLPKADRDKFVEILERELSIVKPVAVVTWGNPSADIARNLKFPHHPFPHPSSAAGGAWKKLMDKSPTYANKLAYWKSSVTRVLTRYPQ